MASSDPYLPSSTESDSDGYTSDNVSNGESVALRSERYALMRQVRTSAGADRFVQSVVQQTILSSNCDWGALLNSAPRALCHLGQCFVVASSPLAASLKLPPIEGLQATSLRGNLVICSDLGRSAFREAEAKMGNLSNIAQAVCENDGTIDRILEAVEDDELAELELPRQLKKLEKLSQACLNDTKSVQQKVAEWKEYALKIRVACEDETVMGDEKRLESEMIIKDNSKIMKKDEVVASKEQTTEYKKRLELREDEYAQSQKSMRRGAWSDLGSKAAETVMGAVSSILRPSFGLNLSFGSSNAAKDVDETSEALENLDLDVDRGYELAGKIQPWLVLFSALMRSGNDPEYFGMDWDNLSGRGSDSRKSAAVIVGVLQDYLHKFSTESTPMTRAVFDVANPVLFIGKEIIKMIEEQAKMNFRWERSTHEQKVRQWTYDLQIAEEKNGKIITEREFAKKEKAKELRKRKQGNRKHKRSKAEIRFERFQQAQEALAQAEELLSQRMEAERKANEEFNEIQLELQRLGDEKVTVAKVKDILQRCIKNLERFAERLDELNTFFTHVQLFIERINDDRVDNLIGGAKTTRKIVDRASETDREQKKQKRLDSLRVDALMLRGFYLVAQTMADTYVDVSAQYIIPGVNKIDRLSINADDELSETGLQEKIEGVEHFARQAQSQISKLARERKDALLDELIVDRGEAQEVLAIADGAKPEQGTTGS